MFLRIWIAFILLILSVFCANAQNNIPFQKEISYHITAELDTANKILNGTCLIHYKNNSPDTLKEVWLYLRPNACHNENSIFNNRLIEKGNTDLYFSEKKDRGYMTISCFQMGDTSNQFERTIYFSVEQNQFLEFGKIKLASPLPPGQDVSIQITYDLKLSKLYEGFATGYVDDMYIFSQWHPEVVQYNESSWHFQSFIGDNEADQPSASYTADIYLPEGYELICNGKTVSNNETIEWHLESKNFSKLVWGIIPSKKIKKEIIKHGKLSITYYGKAGFNNDMINAVHESNEIATNFDSDSAYIIMQIPSKKKLTPVFFDDLVFTFGNTTKQDAKNILKGMMKKTITNKFDFEDKFNNCETYFDNNIRSLWSISKLAANHLPNKMPDCCTSDTAMNTRKIKLTWLYNFNNSSKYRYVSFSPSLLYNGYDKWMPGLFVHNIQFPKNKFQFELLPLYSIVENKWRGAGGVQWTLFDNRRYGKIELRNSYRSFGKDRYLNDASQQIITAYTKLQSGIRYYFPYKYPKCVQHYIEWNSSLIKETNPRYIYNSATGIVSIQESNERYILHQLAYQYQNNRTLYPYTINIKAEMGKPFLRFGIEANEFFNYAKEGGMNLRFFAGKFIYLQSTNNLTSLENQRFHFNISAPGGYEDYRYDGYFLERNAFEGDGSKQIMIRDGGFKMSTPLLIEKVGRTDHWLGAINLTTTIPDKMNILKVLPVKIPLLLFCDIGTTAENWKDNTDSEQILYEAGLQLSLFKNSCNIYLPLIYSRSFRNYANSMHPDKKLRNLIRFSIDLDKFDTKSIF